MPKEEEDKECKRIFLVIEYGLLETAWSAHFTSKKLKAWHRLCIEESRIRPIKHQWRERKEAHNITEDAESLL